MLPPGSSIEAIRLTVLDIQRSLQSIEGSQLTPQSNFWTLRDAYLPEFPAPEKFIDGFEKSTEIRRVCIRATRLDRCVAILDRDPHGWNKVETLPSPNLNVFDRLPEPGPLRDGDRDFILPNLILRPEAIRPLYVEQGPVVLPGNGIRRAEAATDPGLEGGGDQVFAGFVHGVIGLGFIPPSRASPARGGWDSNPCSSGCRDPITEQTCY
jgi:hypothetical protein